MDERMLKQQNKAMIMENEALKSQLKSKEGIYSKFPDLQYITDDDTNFIHI